MRVPQVRGLNILGLLAPVAVAPVPTLGLIFLVPKPASIRLERVRASDLVGLVSPSVEEVAEEVMLKPPLVPVTPQVLVAPLSARVERLLASDPMQASRIVLKKIMN